MSDDRPTPPPPVGAPRDTTPPVAAWSPPSAPAVPRAPLGMWAPAVAGPPVASPPIATSGLGVTPPIAPPPPRGPRRRGTVVAIVAGATAFVLLLGFVVWGASTFAHRIAAAPAARTVVPSASGPRIGSHWASSPLSCHDACLSPTIGQMYPRKSDVTAIGAPHLTDEGENYDSETASEAYDDVMSTWRTDKPTGDDCMFIYGLTPVDAEDGVRPHDDGSRTEFTSEYASDTDADTADSVLDQGMRTFQATSDATAYMHRMESRIAQCRHYSTTAKDAEWSSWVNAVSRWGRLPADVSAVGWVEGDATDDLYYGVDLQRGNLVVRTSYGACPVSPADFQAFVTRTAERMERLDPHAPAPNA